MIQEVLYFYYIISEIKISFFIHFLKVCAESGSYVSNVLHRQFHTANYSTKF